MAAPNPIPSARVKRWRDIDAAFVPAPRTRDALAKTDVEAIKQQMRMILQYESGDDLFHPETAVGLRNLTFETWTPQVESIAKKLIENCLVQWVPRAELVEAEVDFDPDQNEFVVKIRFKVKSVPEVIEFKSIVRRLR